MGLFHLWLHSSLLASYLTIKFQLCTMVSPVSNQSASAPDSWVVGVCSDPHTLGTDHE